MSRATIVLGGSALARAYLAGPVGDLDLEAITVKPVHRAFRPMVEETAYDICELAIVTTIQAIEAGRPIIALPITVAARFQHRCLVQNANFTDLGPGDLAGKRVAVRAYSQTTGTWVRTILDTEFGVDPGTIEWITQEAPHVSGAPEPANVIRDPEGAATVDLLREGKVAAAIFGNDMPQEDWVRPVIPDPDAAARQSHQASGLVQINHIVSMSRQAAARDPALARAVWDSFLATKAALPEGGPDLLPMGAEAMRPSVETLLGSVHRQGLTRRLMTFDDIFGEAAGLLG